MRSERDIILEKLKKWCYPHVPLAHLEDAATDINGTLVENRASDSAGLRRFVADWWQTVPTSERNYALRDIAALSLDRISKGEP